MSDPHSKLWKRRWKWVVAGATFAIILMVVLGARLARSKPSVPTAEVMQGLFQDTLELQGEVKALRSVDIDAPRHFGQLTIIRLAADGSTAHKGEMVVEFDSSQLQAQLASDQSALETAVAQVQASEAQAKLTDQQDVTTLLTDRYNLQSAQLDASKRAILSRIDGAEAELKVTDAKLALKQAEEQLKMDRAASAADLADQKQQQDKARIDVARDERSLAHKELRAPLNGVVTLLTHYTGSGQQTYRPGDQVWAGAQIAELPDLSSLYFDARADETDRSQIRPGQAAYLDVNAIPGKAFPCHVLRISTLASIDYSAPYPFPRNFEVQIPLDHPIPKLRPGMTASARVVIGQVAHAIQVPLAAIFQENGETVAYVLREGKFATRTIQLGARGVSTAVVTFGLKPGERVALERPAAKP